MSIYCVYSGRTGTSTGTVAGSVPTSGEWDNAYISIAECLTSITEANGDTIFVAHDHARNYGAAAGIDMTINAGSGCLKILSIDRTNTTTATLRAGASEESGVNNYYGVNGNLYVYGMTFKTGTGGADGLATHYIGTSTSASVLQVFEKCTFWLNSTSTSPTIQVSATGSGSYKFLEFRSSLFRFGNASQNIYIPGTGHISFLNCSLHGSSTTPTTMFNMGIGYTNPAVKLVGCDFSACTNLFTGGMPDPTWLNVVNCKIPSNVLSGSVSGIGAMVVECHACSSSDSIMDYYYQDGTGAVQENTSVYLTSGGSQMKQADGTLTSYSLELNPSTAASKAFPLYSPWVSKFVGSTGSKTFSLKVAYDSATALKDTECWIEVEYYKNTGDPLSSVEVSAPLAEGISRDILAAGSNLSDTSEAWTGTSGWSNKKTATLSKTVTVNQQGYVRCRVAVAKYQTVYVDQLIGVA